MKQDKWEVNQLEEKGKQDEEAQDKLEVNQQQEKNEQ